MDPQQRLLLEETLVALQSSSTSPQVPSRGSSQPHGSWLSSSSRPGDVDACVGWWVGLGMLLTWLLLVNNICPGFQSSRPKFILQSRSEHTARSVENGTRPDRTQPECNERSQAGFAAELWSAQAKAAWPSARSADCAVSSKGTPRLLDSTHRTLWVECWSIAWSAAVETPFIPHGDVQIGQCQLVLRQLAAASRGEQRRQYAIMRRPRGL